MKKVKNTIPVYDICSLQGKDQLSNEIIAEPFASYLEAHPNLPLPHRHSFFHMVLFTKGAGHHTIDFQQFPVAPGQIYFMKPGQVHSWNFEGETDGYVINFSEHLFEHFLMNSHYTDAFSFFQGVADDCVIALDAETFAGVKTTFKKIVQEVHSNEAQSADLLRVYLIELFVLVSRSVSKAEQSLSKPQNQLLLHNFRKLVDIHYAEKRLPKDYAALLYITPNHLNALSKDLLGRSAGEVIRDRILLEAKRLLINVDISIADIAAKLSFTDSSHFTKFFKKYTGITPEGFRKSSFGRV
ncbi:AraC family transcriptional regulator [Polluticoccus soli]|uniref:AraC family transcriptional regulator n=1 Tax=Polluticoccus soli TaxID=3034150 RepID=UPI0023E1EA52|nr:helix-turn-helix transcriptional regulator [Flavipsychrobacter sp. JY13-12]